MEKTLFAELPQSERIQALEDNCHKVEVMGYLKRFSEDELSALKTELSEILIKVDAMETEKAELMKEFTEKLKPIKTELKSMLSWIKQRSMWVDEATCFKFLDEPARRAYFYNEQGELVDDRPMRPEEYQRSIFPIKKEGTND